ncbi:hypothetical protein ACLEPN_05325 [Myxococcus sp. 1LA]
MRTAPWMMAVVLAGAPAFASQAQAPCGGLRFESGRVVFGRTLAPQGAETDACLAHVAEALLARPAIRSVTVAAKLPDADRLDGRGLAVAKRAADALVAAGLARTRVSAVAPPSVEGEPAQLQLAYVERPTQPSVARLRAPAARWRPVRRSNSSAPGWWVTRSTRASCCALARTPRPSWRWRTAAWCAWWRTASSRSAPSS